MRHLHVGVTDLVRFVGTAVQRCANGIACGNRGHGLMQEKHRKHPTVVRGAHFDELHGFSYFYVVAEECNVGS